MLKLIVTGKEIDDHSIVEEAYNKIYDVAWWVDLYLNSKSPKLVLTIACLISSLPKDSKSFIEFCEKYVIAQNEAFKKSGYKKHAEDISKFLYENYGDFINEVTKNYKLKEVPRVLTETTISRILNYAQSGYRIEYNDKTIWQGLGNRSGLHSFVDDLLREKWEKSGKRFENKLRNLIKNSSKGDVFTIKKYENVVWKSGINKGKINRDKGRWNEYGSFTS